MTTLEPPTKAKATESFLCMPPDRHKKKEVFRLTQREMRGTAIAAAQWIMSSPKESRIAY